MTVNNDNNYGIGSCVIVTALEYYTLTAIRRGKQPIVCSAVGEKSYLITVLLSFVIHYKNSSMYLEKVCSVLRLYEKQVTHDT